MLYEVRRFREEIVAYKVLGGKGGIVLFENVGGGGGRWWNKLCRVRVFILLVVVVGVLDFKFFS